jgi:hypothetical protein
MARSVDEVALIQDTLSYYAPVLIAPLSNPSRRPVGNFFLSRRVIATHNWEDRGSKLFAEGQYGDDLGRPGERR